MKKITYLFLTLLFLVFPKQIKASTYGIENYYIDATIKENGDLYIKELFILNGDYNGMERILDFQNPYAKKATGTIKDLEGSSLYNGSNIVVKEVKAIDTEGSIFSDIEKMGIPFQKVSLASKGDFGVYTIQSTSSGKKVQIYNPSHKNIKGFYLEYVIENIAVVHKDIGELGWNIFSDKLTESVKNLEVHIHIPSNTFLRGWGHGPLTGDIRLEKEELVILKITNLEERTALDTRLVFAKEVIKDSKKKSGLTALSSILSIEQELADQANEERKEYYEDVKEALFESLKIAEEKKNRPSYEKAKRIYNFFKEQNDLYSLGYDPILKQAYQQLLSIRETVEKKEQFYNVFYSILSIGWLLGLIKIVYHVYKKYDKEYELEFKGEYYRDFPANYTPSTVGYLIRRNINNDDLSASILSLIQQKKISFTSLDEKQKNFLFKKEKNEDFSSEEEALMKFLFNEKEEVKLSDLKKNAKASYNSFIKRYTNWKKEAEANALKEEFYETNIKVKFLFSLYSISGIFLFALLVGTDFQLKTIVYVLAILLIISSITSMIYFIAFTKKTKKGNEQYHKWMALKKFMEDFGTMDEKELPEVRLWEKYLVYALTLGCAKKLSKSMELRIRAWNMDENMADTLLDISYMNQMVRLNRIMNDAIHNAVTSAYSQKAESPSGGSFSSGGGFGGGFSGGGGSFGGGGGGGRF